MRDVPADWLDDPGEDPDGRPRRSGLLLAAAAVPWLVVVALLVLPGRLGGVNGAAPVEPAPGQPPGEAAAGGPAAEVADTFADIDADADTDADTGADTDADGDTAATPPDAHADEPDAGGPGSGGAEGHDATSLWVAEHRARWRTEPGPEEAAALAVAVARAWLTGIGPHLAVDGVPVDDAARYAEHLVVEAVEQPAPEAAVVTLLAVVLEGDELEAAVRRLAVPLAWDEQGPRPAGPPWWLPGPVLTAHLPDVDPLDDPDTRLAAQAALETAGFETVEIHGLGRTSGWPVVAEVSARTPDGSSVEGPVWLRPHLDGYVVAGTTAAPSTETGGGRE